ncbi:MAG: UTRA domain-containing protein, partial [Erysipelotrichaceae bacterium]|nr:UTRA domain-containing protein [Erysipelotrichaceae bacterium]
MSNKNIFIYRDLTGLEPLLEVMKNSGLSFEYRILSQDIVEINKYIGDQLEMPIASKVLYIKTLWIVEGKARMLEHEYINISLGRSIHDGLSLPETGNVFDWIRKNTKLQANSREEEVKIVRASAEEAEQLGVDIESEVMMVKGRAYNKESV